MLWTILDVDFRVVLSVLMPVAIMAVLLIVDVAVDFGILGTTAPPRNRMSLVLTLIIFVVVLAFFLIQVVCLLVGGGFGGVLLQLVVMVTSVAVAVLADGLGLPFKEVIVLITVAAASWAVDSRLRGFSIGRGFGPAVVVS